ncbi:MAG: hypothetical protein ACI9YO_001652 [Gammaproteobacteria bacterium]|jgi:hypothetical protein
MCDTVKTVISNAGSCFGLVTLLVGFINAQPFTIIVKLCDLNADAAFTNFDARVEKLCLHQLAMVCGGQSGHKKYLRPCCMNLVLRNRN